MRVPLSLQASRRQEGQAHREREAARRRFVMGCTARIGERLEQLIPPAPLLPPATL